MSFAYFTEEILCLCRPLLREGGGRWEEKTNWVNRSSPLHDDWYAKLTQFWSRWKANLWIVEARGTGERPLQGPIDIEEVTNGEGDGDGLDRPDGGDYLAWAMDYGITNDTLQQVMEGNPLTGYYLFESAEMEPSSYADNIYFLGFMYYDAKAQLALMPYFLFDENESEFEEDSDEGMDTWTEPAFALPSQNTEWRTNLLYLGAYCDPEKSLFPPSLPVGVINWLEL